MILTYSLRLACICFLSFFLVQSLFTSAVSLAARGAIRAASRMAPRFAARFLFAVRMSPLFLAGFVVFGLCVPSFLWLEPSGGGEQVGWPSLLMALFGVWVCLGSAVRVFRALARSRQYRMVCGETGRPARLGKNFTHAMVVPHPGPLLAVSGIFRSHLIVSASVLQGLSAEELDAALRHERAHGIWRDNFKRLLFLSAPRGFALSRGLRTIEQQWSKFAEWAADDFAAAGDPREALSLAAALVRIARLGTPAAQPAILSSLAQSSDLSERVERLLAATPAPHQSARRMQALTGSLALLVSFFLASGILWPASLSTVHSLLERLIG